MNNMIESYANPFGTDPGNRDTSGYGINEGDYDDHQTFGEDISSRAVDAFAGLFGDDEKEVMADGGTPQMSYAGEEDQYVPVRGSNVDPQGNMGL